MLDLFGYELDRFHGEAADFRSKVYTPVLQRQLKGVHDAYAPSIKRAIAQSDEDPTIAQVTRFYLGNDPLDPRCIPCYRRNIIYSREALWHLAIITGKMKFDSAKDFESSLFYSDLIHNDLQKCPKPCARGIPPTVCVDSTAALNALTVPWISHGTLKTGLACEINHPMTRIQAQIMGVPATIWSLSLRARVMVVTTRLRRRRRRRRRKLNKRMMLVVLVPLQANETGVNIVSARGREVLISSTIQRRRGDALVRPVPPDLCLFFSPLTPVLLSCR
jgi:hypothetical protein